MEKQEILSEIKRTAGENNGVPLGRLRFFNETGVKEHDWRGKYWSRWSDAVREAGFSPNQKTEASDEGSLLESLAGLIREIGRFPTGSDIRLRARKGDGFPYDNTFRRIGTKAEIARKVITQIQNREGFESVLAICEQLTEDGSKVSIADSTSSPSKEGFVYLIQSGRRYKIGATNDLARRSQAIAVQMPDRTDTVHVIRTDDPFGIEAYWHKRFSNKRTNGEWFELDRSEVAAFKRRKTM